MKTQTAREAAELFRDRLNEPDLISAVFDTLNFDCSIRGFIDSDELDQRIKAFFRQRDLEHLVPIIELILRGKKEAQTDDMTLFCSIREYISEHLAEKLTVEQIAGVFHISYYYLCHFFKRIAGQPLNQFIIAKRIEKAARLLCETDAKVSEIASLCGFDASGYFSETFIKRLGETPLNFRKLYSDRKIHPFYEIDDILLAAKLPFMSFLSEAEPLQYKGNHPYIPVHNPNDGFGTFLHEAAITVHKGTIYASWYNCKEKELIGYTPIVGRRSRDGGKTWTEPEIIAEDKSGNILYCPPVYGSSDGKLYMLINEMVSADHIHALDLYVLNEETDRFEFVWSRPIPFKLNTNVVTLPNGKLMIPGRIAELDGFPNTPAVLISDSGTIDGEWRVVKVAENGDLPDGERLVHPETTVICLGNILYLFNRNDRRGVPLVYVSEDFGESWSGMIAHDIPYRSSKIYGGVLSDGRPYLIANSFKNSRAKLALYVGEEDKPKFTKQILLMDCDVSEDDMIRCHYPAAVEHEGTLYIIATADYAREPTVERGAVLIPVDLAAEL